MRHSIDKGPYKRKDNPDPNNDQRPYLKHSAKYAKTMWARIKMLIQGSEISQQERHSMLMNEFDKFVAVEGESLKSVYERGDTRRCLEDKLTNAMMLMARVITQCYSTPTNNRLRTSSNTRNQAVIQDGRVDIQSKNVGYAGNGNKNAGRINRIEATNAGNGLVQSIEEYDHNVERIPRTESTPGKTNVQGYNYNGKGHYACECPNPSNDFMLDNAYGDNTLKELNAAVIMMAHIQPTDNKSDAKPTYDAEFISEVHASQIDMINGLLSKSDHKQSHHEKLETIIHTSVDDQIDYDIIFDDQFVDNDS
ncbi:hypothetical protein Tco_0682456 [Tanacetum coccineum]|uniref:Polyprotein n=1 Tax=Tanacetum coccineum TaxID=301880 RepID=A0ABQ4XSR2_9ASTR